MKPLSDMTNDDLRVLRSIESVLAKCEASMERLRPKSYLREKEFEQMCYKRGILYSPNKLI